MRKDIFIPAHNTNVLPLRWLANYVFHPISMFFFRVALSGYDQIYESGEGYTIIDEIKESLGVKLYKFFGYPYDKWGTVYVLDKNFLSETTGLGWDDYDENGVPYWNYFWHNDEETGDGWRLINKDQLTFDEMKTIYGVNSEEDIDRID